MKKTLALLLSLALLATMFAVPALAESNDKPYAGTKLTWWVELNSNLTGVTDNLANTKWYQAVYDATGIEIEFLHPAAGNAAAEFATMLTGELPDIMEYSWTNYNGGASAAIADDVVIALDEYMAAGQTPYLSAVLADNGEIDRSIRTADGQYYCFPCLRGTTYENNNCLFTSGFYMRGDILKELGLDIPETIEEWDTVLRAVKAAYPDMIPFGTRTEWMNQIFCPGFDNWNDYYVEDGVVKNGLVEDAHYEYLKTMAGWYADGLIDPDYLTHTKAGDVRGLMAEGNVFATYDACGGGASAIIPALLSSGKIADESDIVTTVPVTSVKGQNAKFSKMNGLYDASTASAAITTDCDNVEAALWLLDWFYSDEARMINCFGIEGESYNMVDGYPTFTDVILHNETLTVAQSLANYCRAQLSGPAIQDVRVNEQYYSYTAQVTGMSIWTRTDYGMYMFPAGAAVATADADDFATITSNVKTYREEMEAKWITGQAELTDEAWAAYVAQMEAYGMSRAIGYKQAAYDAFMGN
ncbi:MAG: extracellular solute-binding protein [Aristaeellaceae bacterium]